MTDSATTALVLRPGGILALGTALADLRQLVQPLPDVLDLELVGLANEIDTAIAEAVKGLHAVGYSWAEIGSRLGITRQAAQQRWGAS